LNLGLARLALRRALPPGLVATAVVLAAFFLATTWRPAPLEAEALLGSIDPRSAASAIARQGLWAALLATLAPFLVARAALILPGWRRGEVDWLFASASTRTGLALSAYLGLAAAAAIFVVFDAAVAELAAGRAGPGRALAARFATPTVLLAGDEPIVRGIDLGRSPAGAALRVRILLVGGGPAADLRLAVRAVAADGAVHATRARLATSGNLEVTLPRSEGPFELSLERTGGESLVALERDGIELVTPVASERVGSLRLAARSWLALCAMLAVALGLGAWLSAPTAAIGALSLGLAALLAGSTVAPALPLASLKEALSLTGEGLAAPWPSWRALVASAATIVLGLTLAAAGLRHWRCAP